MSVRTEINDYITKKYGSAPEFLWQRDPDSCIYRHGDNKKWFAIIMIIPKNKLGLDGCEKVEVLNLKLTDILTAELVARSEGFFPAYHMSKNASWITVLLDGTIKTTDIIPFIDESFAVTASTPKKNKLREPKEWLVPSNPKHYDVVSDLEKRDVIEWKQGAGIKVGDTVFLYVGAPKSAVLYKFAVLETGIPYDFNNGKLVIKSLMKIKLLHRYDEDEFTLERLRTEFGVNCIRGPRGVPHALSAALNNE